MDWVGSKNPDPLPALIHSQGHQEKNRANIFSGTPGYKLMTFFEENSTLINGGSLTPLLVLYTILAFLHRMLLGLIDFYLVFGYHWYPGTKIMQPDLSSKILSP